VRVGRWLPGVARLTFRVSLRVLFRVLLLVTRATRLAWLARDPAGGAVLLSPRLPAFRAALATLPNAVLAAPSLPD